MGVFNSISGFFNNRKLNKLKIKYINDFKETGKLADITDIQEFISKKDIKVIGNTTKYGDKYDYIEQIFDEEDIHLKIKENRTSDILKSLKKLPDIVSDCAWQGEFVYESDEFKMLKDNVFRFDKYYSIIERNNKDIKIDCRDDFEINIDDLERMTLIVNKIEQKSSEFDYINYSKTMCDIIKAYSLREVNTCEDFKTKQDIIIKAEQVLDNIYSNDRENGEIPKDSFCEYARSYPSPSTLNFFERIDNISKLKDYGIDIDLNDERVSFVDASNEEKNSKFYEQLEERKKDIRVDDIDVRDIAMVRTTPFITKNLEMEMIDELNSRVYEENFLSELLGEEYKTLSTMYRSTKHFTLNGLVASHELGNFSGRPYIFIDGLEKHINKDNMLALDEADTYFEISREEPFKLSTDAEIMMPIEEYLKVKDDKDIMKEISLYKKLTLFSGDEKTAVDMRLLKKGYIPESIGKWGYDYDAVMGQAINKIANEYNKPRNRHFGSDIQKSDYEKWNEMEQASNKKFVNAIFEEFKIDEKYKEYAIRKRLSEEEVDKIVNYCGKEKLKAFIDDYNMNIKEELDKKRDEYYLNNQKDKSDKML